MLKKVPFPFVFSVIIFLTFMVAGCTSATPAASTPEVITILQTVPVEVEITVEVPVEATRLVEVTRMVEVTRQVIQTELVPVTVTPTPSPEATFTPVPPTAGSVAAVATPIFGKPQEKVPGIAPLRVWNTTQDTLTVVIEGPAYYRFSLTKNNAVFLTVKEAKYTYQVFSEDKLLYTGSMNITNPDKYELHLKENRAAFLIP